MSRRAIGALMVACGALGFCSPLVLRAAEPRLETAGTISAPRLREASGLVASRTQPGVFWSLADSGNEPHLFALDRQGELLAEFRLADAINLDWESLAADDNGRLYVGDVGGNLLPGLLTRRWVYRVLEPQLADFPATDAGGPPQDLPQLEIERTIVFRFPKQPVDIEAMFVQGEWLWLIGKEPRAAPLFKLSLSEPAAAAEPEGDVPHPSLDTPWTETTLLPAGRLPGVRLVTGSDLSADGRRLAVCSYRYAAIFTLPAEDPWKHISTLAPRVVRFQRTQIEACAWEGDDLYLASEDRKLYRLAGVGE